MTSNPVTINPGGRQATGGFSEWWNTWFGARATEIVEEILPRAEKQIRESAMRELRTIRTGKAPTKKTFTLQSISGKENAAYQRVLADERRTFDGDNYDEDDE